MYREDRDKEACQDTAPQLFKFGHFSKIDIVPLDCTQPEMNPASGAELAQWYVVLDRQADACRSPIV
ncbi:MAG: hypothetical protein DWI22_00405 [Planctomycetota bacterium]|nr:MAG: hypothetical protein DWI22_00405 [Planctomycetota bacterium]